MVDQFTAGFTAGVETGVFIRSLSMQCQQTKPFPLFLGGLFSFCNDPLLKDSFAQGQKLFGVRWRGRIGNQLIQAKTNVSGMDISTALIRFADANLVGAGIESALGDFGFWLEGAQVTDQDRYSRWSTGVDYAFTESLVGMIEYHFNEALLASFGYLRTDTGIDAQYMLPENPELDANTIGGGIAYAFNEKFTTNFSLGYVFYEDDSFVYTLLEV